MKNPLFGPVPSRRLGRSLGVDVVPFKFCPYDCVYCELGCTTRRELTRRPYIRVEEVRDSIAAADLSDLDYITFGGSGEPTLCCNLDRMVAAVKAITDVPVAILTNSALLSDPAVRQELMGFDLVVPSLDAADETVFTAVNRPHSAVDFTAMVEGLRRFCQEFTGRLWLEVLLVKGVSDQPAHLDSLAELAASLEVDLVDLNTVARPPAEPWACALETEELEAAALRFRQPVRIPVYHQHQVHDALTQAPAEAMVSLLGRRPCTAEDLAGGLGLRLGLVVKYLDLLKGQGRVVTRENDGRHYYTLAR